MKLFPAIEPLLSVGIDILGPLQKSKSGRRFLLVITDRFTKMTEAFPLKKIDDYTVAKAFAEEWVFKFGIPEKVLWDNGSQFSWSFFRRVCQVMGIAKAFTSTYHPQTNGKQNATIDRFPQFFVATFQNTSITGPNSSER